jgi:hypothetical protein
MALPPLSLVRAIDTHRLIPSRYLPHNRSVLAGIAENDVHLAAIAELDNATNDRLLAEHELLPGIGPDELVFGIPNAAIINASFCHAHPLGSRFSSPIRGAWYAGFELATAQAEVAFHKTVQLAEIGRFEDSVTYNDYLADFSANLHDLRRARGFRACLVPESYVESQALAERLLAENSLGVVYPSVRRKEGTCLACFRPAIVSNVRRDKTYRLTWEGESRPIVTAERSPG